MVSMKFFSRSAYLASVIISCQNIPAPLFIFPGAAATPARLIFLFALIKIGAFRRAIRMIEMAVCWHKSFPASFASKLLARTISTGINTLATQGTSDFIKHNPTSKRFSANDTNPFMAIGAVIRAWIVDCESRAASFAISLKCKGLVFHAPIIPQIVHIQRWVDMTGGTPELLCNEVTTP